MISFHLLVGWISEMSYPFIDEMKYLVAELSLLLITQLTWLIQCTKYIWNDEESNLTYQNGYGKLTIILSFIELFDIVFCLVISILLFRKGV